MKLETSDPLCVKYVIKSSSILTASKYAVRKNYHVIPVYSTVFVFVCSFKGYVFNQPTCSCKNACQGQYYLLIFNNE